MMSHVILAWELGAGYGHLGRLLTVASALNHGGHRLTFIVRDLYRAQTVLDGRGFAILQAPLWLGPAPAGRTVPSYAGTLLQHGYHRVVAFGGLLAAWRRMFAWLAPDLVLLDHAPTATLAAHSLDLAAARLGSGYDSPPRARPLPPFPTAAPVEAGRLIAAEETALATINATFAALHVKPLTRLADLFDGATEFLCTFAELDHYGARADASYWGPLETAFGRTRPDWPGGAAPRVFVFLDAGHPALEPLAGALRRLALPTLLHVRDLPSVRRQRLESDGLRIVAEPVDLDWAVARAGLVVCAASHGASAAALLAGRPLLLLPRHAEQAMVARRVVELGAGLAIDVEEGPADFVAALRRLADDAALAAAARRFAAAHDGFSPAAAAEAVVARCLALCAATAAPVTAG